jgi:CheY-like chemotaxis protein
MNLSHTPMTDSAQTVLVIDDDLMMGELMAAVIDSAEFHTVVAGSGREGVELAQSVLPSIVLCDFTMPGMSGEDVVRSLRADPRTAGIPVVLMSGHAPSDLQYLAADAFLQKPFCTGEVLPVLRSVLQTHGEQGARTSESRALFH